MKISRQIYEQLLQLPAVSPETGGILGSSGEEIDTMIIDTNQSSCCNGIYTPDVSFLNRCIEKWTAEGIVFMGMFHTHALNWPTLSSEDKKYIQLIMKAMPNFVDRLYFPLIFPSNHMKVFQAIRSEGQIVITEDGVEFIQEVLI